MKSTTPLVIVGGVALLIFVVAMTFWRAGDERASATAEGDAIAQDVLSDIPQYQEISAQAVQQLLYTKGDSTGIIDIRSSRAFANEHIIGAINFPAKSLVDGGISPAYNKQKLIVVAELIGRPALERVVEILSAQNPNIVVLTGGMNAFKAIGGSTISTGNTNNVTDRIKVTYISFGDLRKISNAIQNKNNFRNVIIDVRPEADFALGAIPTAINIPLAQLERRSSEIPSTKQLIVYGATAEESFRGGVRLNDLGFSLTQTLEGGYQDWNSDK